MAFCSHCGKELGEQYALNSAGQRACPSGKQALPIASPAQAQSPASSLNPIQPFLHWIVLGIGGICLFAGFAKDGYPGATYYVCQACFWGIAARIVQAELHKQ